MYKNLSLKYTLRAKADTFYFPNQKQTSHSSVYPSNAVVSTMGLSLFSTLAVLSGLLRLSDQAPSPHLPPLLLCQDVVPDVTAILPQCPSICKYDWDLSSAAAIELFNQVEKENIPLRECCLYTDIVRTSESYLWSRDHEMLSSERSVPDTSRCKELIKNHCSQQGCKYHETLPELTYEWGSELITTYERYVIETVKETVVLLEGVSPKLAIDNKRVDLSAGYLVLEDSKRILFWDLSNQFSKECPLKNGKTAVAYQEIGQSKNLWVPDLGMKLNKEDSHFHDSRCFKTGQQALKELHISKEGIIFSIDNDAASRTSSSSVIVISSSLKENEKLILKMINDLELNKAREFCLSQCYGIEQHGMHMLGNGGIYTLEDGSGYQCSHFIAAQVSDKASICKDPLGLLQVVAAHKTIWWDPETPYLSPFTQCNRLLKRSFPKNFKRGALIMNRSGIFLSKIHMSRGLSSDAFSQTHLGSYLSDQSELKISQSYEFGTEIISNGTSKYKLMDEHEGWISDIFSSVSKYYHQATSWISEVSDEIRLVLFTFLVGLGITVLLWMKSKLLPKKKSAAEEYIPMIMTQGERPVRHI
uniref:G n=1 Tax=Dioscorea composita virus 1 TaxID=2793727 RepID=A0A8D9UIV1_9RHAB|nr:TPA_asm: G [Dioscorea composita virus 1]